MTETATLRRFELYPEERHWWSFNDYGTVLEAMRRFRPMRVLEFGPGSSTLALIEGGAAHIDSCEDQPDWFDVHSWRVGTEHAKVVTIHKYDYGDPIVIPALMSARYDFALVDGPRGTPNRPTAIRFALEHADVVMTPTEDHGRRERSLLRPILRELAKTYHRDLELIESGPLSGGFAILTRQTASTRGDDTDPATDTTPDVERPDPPKRGKRPRKSQTTGEGGAC